MTLTLFVIMSAVIYRLARFLILDTLIDVPRDAFNDWLTERPGRLTIKLQELMQCPFCVTIWVSAGANTYWYTLVEDWPGWAWPLYWLGTAAGALIFWTIIDSED